MKFFAGVILGSFVLLASAPVFSQENDESVEAAMAASLAADRAKKRNYPGGADEQDLMVQPSLPQPARAPEAQAQVSTSGSSEEAAHD